MSNQVWTAVDAYLDEKLVHRDAALEAALADNDAAGLPAMSVSPTYGKLLHVLALSVGAKSIVEVGTLGGYSTIWMARALPPGGRLVTLEINPKMAEVARKNIARADQSEKVELILGPALDSLRRLEGPFDFAFIDANKTQNVEYFQACLELVRPGGLIIVDNVVRDGQVLDAGSKDADVQGVRRLFEVIGAEPRVTVTALQTVGAKGHDGLAIARVN
jgi:predicted O-methyltransferase YrrM